MSLDHRLDNELQKAFKREQPSADFTMRLLERVSREGAPRQSWWKRLAVLLGPPKLRWVAIGATATLLLAIAAMQYTSTHQSVVDEQPSVAKNPGVPDPNANPGDQSPRQSVNNATAPRIKPAASSSTNRRLVKVGHRQNRELQAEGEAAKEKLLLALSIASSALGDAQRAVHDDGLRP